MQAQGRRLLKDADRNQVVRADQPRRPQPSGQQPPRRLAPSGHGEGRVGDELLLRFQPDLEQGSLVAGPLLARRQRELRTGGEADECVAEREQVLAIGTSC